MRYLHAAFFRMITEVQADAHDLLGARHRRAELGPVLGDEVALRRGARAFGEPLQAAEIALAQKIIGAFTRGHVEMVRFVSSGTEATMSAVRLARGATARSRILKFEGCYHGHSDSFLVAAGSGAATFGAPTSPGVPAEVARDTLLAPYNDLEAVRRVVKESGDALAAIIVEPVAGNMGCVPPVPGFLEALRLLCDASGALLVFDEVITGFRVARGGAQERFGVTPDLTVLGKIVGGGLPGGRVRLARARPQCRGLRSSRE